MKLSLLYESKIPKELEQLSRNYWRIRSNVFKKAGRAIEPYICNLITDEIAQELSGLGYIITYMRTANHYGLHVWLKAKRDNIVYNIDGSAYQFYYDKPIDKIIDKRTANVMGRHNLHNLAGAVAVIDYVDGHGTSWTDVGDYQLDFSENDLAAAATELGSPGLNRLRGRLLPLMLMINHDITTPRYSGAEEIKYDQLHF